MGTTIRLIAEKETKTTPEQWVSFCEKFNDVYAGSEICGGTYSEYIEIPKLHTTYSSASLEAQMELFKEFKGSGIVFSLYYLENDPDEQEVL